MNEKLIEQLFPGITERIKNNKCPTCGASIDKTTFKDELSIKEYTISGMCQKCQDEVFS